MKPGRASLTAVYVCMGRALAHGATSAPRFDDPTALTLLPDDARARVLRLRGDAPPLGLRARFFGPHLRRLAQVMVARTVGIDDAVRERPTPQVVILGAGLDGRAWRMRELAGAVVFEVDHPDSQRDKRARSAALAKVAEVRFVPVDFERDALDDALARAGHDPSRPTLWIWEGVVMYLALPDIESTLGVVRARSAPGSRLVVVYHHPAKVLRLIALIVARVGEPFRSTFTSGAMRELLGRYGFEAARDEGVAEIGARLGDEVAGATKRMSHLRVVVADRQA
jgi:methyltransferase (TIGR00027 family)